MTEEPMKLDLRVYNENYGVLWIEELNENKVKVSRTTDEEGTKVLYPPTEQKKRWYQIESVRDKVLRGISEEYKVEIISKIGQHYGELERIREQETQEKEKEQQRKQELSEEEEKEAIEFLKDPLILQKICLLLDFKVAGLTTKKLLTFLSCMSRNNPNKKKRISLDIYGKWGEGKSTVEGGVLSLFDHTLMTTATEASIYRKSLENPRFFDNKIVYFGDLGDDTTEEQMNVFNVFKQLVSEGKVEKHLVLDTDGEQANVTLRLEGTPVMIWTSQGKPSEGQLLSRVLPSNIDVSVNQRKIVKEYSTYEEDTPEELLFPRDIQELERKWRLADKVLEKETYQVLNPWAKWLNEVMAIDSPNVNRDRHKLFGLIDTITHLRVFQREKAKYGESEYLIVDPQDILDALYICSEDFEVLFGDFDAITMRAYNHLKEKVGCLSMDYNTLKVTSQNLGEEAKLEFEEKEFTNNDLAKWLSISHSQASIITKTLYDNGLAEREKRGNPYHYWLLPERGRIKTDGALLFSFSKCVEGLVTEKTFTEWLNRGFFTNLSGQVKNFLSLEELKELPTPESRKELKNFSTPLWENTKKKLFEPGETFDSLINEDSHLLNTIKRDASVSTKQPTENSSNTKKNEDEPLTEEELDMLIGGDNQ